jgi:hypothetical protein
VARRPKKTRPTFDVAHDPIADTQSGWVYRTEATARPEVPQVEQVQQNSEVYDLQAGRAVFSPREQPAQTSSIAYQVLATGVYLMTLPVRLGVNIMLTPVHWILGSRR